jgi:hypothetical protein
MAVMSSLGLTPVLRKRCGDVILATAGSISIGLILSCGQGAVQSEQQAESGRQPGMAISSFLDLVTAISSVGSAAMTLVINTMLVISSDVTVPSNVTLTFDAQGQLVIDKGHSVTVNGAIEAPVTKHIFAGDGQAYVSKSIVHHVPWWGMTPGDAKDHVQDFSKVIASINAAGGGTINFPAGVYRIFNQDNSPAVIPGYFVNVSGVKILGYGATLQIDPDNTYLSEEGNSAFLYFINSKDVFIDGFYGTGPALKLSPGGPFVGVAFSIFEKGCQNIKIPSLKLSRGFNSGLLVKRLASDPPEDISSGFDIGQLDLTSTIYGINAQYSGENMVVQSLKTNGVYRSFFIYGTKHVKATIQSTNSTSPYDVPLAASEGVGLEDIDIDYTNIDSRFSQVSQGVLLTHAGHTRPTVIKDIRIKLNVKYAAASQMAYAFTYQKELDGRSPGIAIGSPLDTEDRGHMLSNLFVTGLIDGTPIRGVPVAIGEPGTLWGVGDYIYDIVLKDLYVVNNVQDQPIMTSLILPALKGRIVQ